ncbi:MAG: hypothetical protein LBT97_09215 [Planctomycetota bacterium]|jgi:hypothetical protein|nr:hypothetical protein [Planctomycetota bacterium]
MDKKRLPLSQIVPGMILAEDIANAAGPALISKGIRLTPMFISRLRKWGFETIDVFLPEQESGKQNGTPGSGGSRVIAGQVGRSAVTPEQEEFVKSVTRDVSIWFQNLREDPLMMQLRVLAIKKLIAIGPDAMLNQLRTADKGGGEGQ